VPTVARHGRRSPRKLLRAVVARLLGAEALARPPRQSRGCALLERKLLFAFADVGRLARRVLGDENLPGERPDDPVDVEPDLLLERAGRLLGLGAESTVCRKA
jgi:hypothetical protein